MTVFWTDAAYEHLLAIRDYLTRTSAVYAEQVVDSLLRRSDTLAAFPHMGRRVPEYDRDDLREVMERSYRLIYRIVASRIEVVAVLHSSQQLPSTL